MESTLESTKACNISNVTLMNLSNAFITDLHTGLNPAATAASFVRPSRPADPSSSFLGALRQKYAPDDISAGTLDEKPIEFSGKVVEEVGFEKVRQQQAILNELRVVVLDGLRVAGLRSDPLDLEPQREEWQACLEEVNDICPKVRELDLSRSLIERWVDVVGICSALPDLRRLVLGYYCLSSFNRTVLITL